MNLTTQSTETFIRRLAAAPRSELEAVRLELKTIAGDDGQAVDVRFISKRTAAIVQALEKRRG